MALVTSSWGDGMVATGITASATVGPFPILGGTYMVATDDTGTAAGTFEIEMPDGQFIAVGTSTTFAAAGTAVVQLPPGSYKWVAGAGITLGSFFVVNVPYFRA